MGKLGYYRKKIDEIDRNIAKLFLLRFGLAEEISHHKKINKIKIRNRKREHDVLRNVVKHSKKHKKFLAGIFKKTISYSRKLQK
ncbi:chorismate mutase [Candidatus Woesearchaeota archaeon]|nr:chorismate mutase [Candidatus Woesearchaeota archaeon]